MSYQSTFDEYMKWLENKCPHQPEFIQAARTIAKDIVPVYNANQDYKDASVLKRLAERV